MSAVTVVCCSFWSRGMRFRPSIYDIRLGWWLTCAISKSAVPWLWDLKLYNVPFKVSLYSLDPVMLQDWGAAGCSRDALDWDRHLRVTPISFCSWAKFTSPHLLWLLHCKQILYLWAPGEALIQYMCIYRFSYVYAHTIFWLFSIMGDINYSFLCCAVNLCCLLHICVFKLEI